MTRIAIPLSITDLSAFTKRLRSALEQRLTASSPVPSHLELLNLLAQSAGFRNYQTLKADIPAEPAAVSTETPHVPNIKTPALSATARKALMQFDASGQLVRLPNKLSVQRMAMWALWIHFQADRLYSEKEVNQILNAHHRFGDQATLRRELVNMQLLGRKSDCSAYWKEMQAIDDEVGSFLAALQAGVQPAPTRGTKAPG